MRAATWHDDGRLDGPERHAMDVVGSRTAKDQVLTTAMRAYGVTVWWRQQVLGAREEDVVPDDLFGSSASRDPAI